MVERFRKVTVESARYGDELVMVRHLLRGPASNPRALRCPGTGGKEKQGGSERDFWSYHYLFTQQDDSEWFKDDSPFSEELANMQHV